MATAFKQGSAPALPIARAFLDMGGRLMINPDGELETGGGCRWAFGSTPASEARRSFVVERRLYRRLRVPSFARSVKCLVVAEGQRTPSGWLVLRKEGE